MQARATLVVQELRKLLPARRLRARPSPLDADLRPEGKNGPLVRSLDSFRTYYERLGADVGVPGAAAGHPDRRARRPRRDFLELINPLRWPEGGIEDSQVRDIRILKARMESERLPRGADPRTHIKLGRGGLTDVEWAVQLHQLEHAHAHPSLRVTAHHGRRWAL